MGELPLVGQINGAANASNGINQGRVCGARSGVFAVRRCRPLQACAEGTVVVNVLASLHHGAQRYDGTVQSGPPRKFWGRENKFVSCHERWKVF